jgi:hypothetical protein
MFLVLEIKGFPVAFNNWIKHVVIGGSINVFVNDLVGPYFKTRKGLQQCLSWPILFNIRCSSYTGYEGY